MLDQEKDLHSLKYSKDDPSIYGFELFPKDKFVHEEEISYDSDRAELLSRSVMINQSVFPDIYQVIEVSKKRLHVKNDINFFVTSNPFPNGYCRVLPNLYAADIILTSSLIELLSLEELKCVIGHEIAHFIFQHLNYPQANQANNEIERFNLRALQRAAEISADRIGFVSCANEKIAFRTELKLASGLSDKFLKENDNFYIEQMELLKKNVNRDLIEATHPSFLSRIYAIHLFSQTKEYHQWIKSQNKGQYSLAEIDQKIEKNLEELSGNERSFQNKEAFDKAYLWISVYLFMLDGTFKENEQITFIKYFSNLDINQLLSFLKIGKRAGLEKRFNESIDKAASLETDLKEKLMYHLELIASQTNGPEKIMLKTLSEIGHRLGIKRAITIREKL